MTSRPTPTRQTTGAGISGAMFDRLCKVVETVIDKSSTTSARLDELERRVAALDGNEPRKGK